MRRLVVGVVVWVLAAVLVPGCGYSEEEMRAKLREIESLKGQLAAEQAESQKAEQEIAEARARIEQLKAPITFSSSAPVCCTAPLFPAPIAPS